jgi:MFS family permease
MPAGAVAGQVLGGVLISADVAGTSWRAIFLVNVPVCAAVLALSARVLPPDDRHERSHLDLPGVATLSVAVLCVVVPLIAGPDAGWPPWTWAALAASVPAVGLFLAAERRALAAGRVPLVDITILARPAIGWPGC